MAPWGCSVRGSVGGDAWGSFHGKPGEDGQAVEVEPHVGGAGCGAGGVVVKVDAVKVAPSVNGQAGCGSRVKALDSNEHGVRGVVHPL